MPANAGSVGMQFLRQDYGYSKVGEVGMLILLPAKMEARVSMVGIQVLVDAIPSKEVVPATGALLNLNIY